MKTLTLIRDDQNEIRTLGTIFDETQDKVCDTLELPWRDNQRGISCIPEGEYVCRAELSPSRGYRVYWLLNVPGRKDVQIHVGNFPKDIRGCILVGAERGVNAVIRSKVTFDRFMERMNGEDFTLIIKKG